MGSVFVAIDSVELQLARNDVNKLSVWIHPYHNWAEALMGLEVGAVWTVTLLIIWKLYWVGHRVARMGADGKSNKYTRIIFVLVQSGLIFTITLAVQLGFWVTGNVSTSYFPLKLFL